MAEERPAHCGTCDPVTRLVEAHLGGELRVFRCPQCHPKVRRLSQFAACDACRMLTYAWDRNPCGQHAAPPLTVYQGRLVRDRGQ